MKSKEQKQKEARKRQSDFDALTLGEKLKQAKRINSFSRETLKLAKLVEKHGANALFNTGNKANY
jgi:hypothetical protein